MKQKIEGGWEIKFENNRPKLEPEESEGVVGYFEGKTYEFGYKYLEGDTIHEVTDWGNIKKFISDLLASERQIICETKIEEPPEGIEGLSDKRQAFLAGQMNMLFRIKFPKQNK